MQLNGNGLYPEAIYAEFDAKRDVYVIDFESYGVDFDNIRGRDIDSIFIDEYSFLREELKRPINLRRKDIMGEFEPMPYDYQQHDRTKRHGKPKRD